MKRFKLTVIIGLVILSMVSLVGCDGLFGPEPVINKFEADGYTYGVTVKVGLGKSQAFNVRGSISGDGAGTLEILADETVLATREVEGEFDISQWSVKFDEAGSFNVKARLTTSEGKESDSGEVTVQVTEVSVDAVYADPYVVAEIGNTVRLNVIVNPITASNRDITYTSDKTSVVAIEGGKPVAKAAGIANITVTTADGGKTATAKVYVCPSDEYPVTVYSSDSTSNDITLGWSDRTTYVFAMTETGSVNIAYDGDTHGLDYEIAPYTSPYSYEQDSTIPKYSTTEATNLDAGIYYLTIRRTTTPTGDLPFEIYLYD